MFMDLEYAQSMHGGDLEKGGLVAIPKGYFCHFEQPLDPALQWKITLERYYSMLDKEEVDIIVTTQPDIQSFFRDSNLKQRAHVRYPSVHDDDDEESHHKRFADNTGLNDNGVTSVMQITLKEDVSKIDVFARMTEASPICTFRLTISEVDESYSIF